MTAEEDHRRGTPSAAERMEIVAAQRDGDGLVIDSGAPAAVTEDLHRNGVERRWRDRWQLTSLGFHIQPGVQTLLAV